MAEYYPLISRAVAGLRTGTPEARKSIYDRARQALVSQLRSMDPPVPEDAIARETAALDDAIMRAEAEVAPQLAEAAPATPPVVAVPQPPALGARGPAMARTPDAPGAPARVLPPKAAMPRPLVRPSNTRPAAPGTVPDAKVAKPEVGTDPAASAAAAASFPRSTSSSVTLPAVAALKVEPNAPPGPDSDLGPTLSASRDELPGNQDEPTVSIAKDFQDDRVRDDSSRPAAPRPVEPRRPNLRVWIVAVAALAAVVAIAFTAWRLRDNPQELARAPAQQTPQTPAGKIVERADGTAAQAEPDRTPVASDQATRSATEPAASPPAAGPDNATATTAPPAAVAGSDNAASATPAPAASQPSIPIAYKAAVLVDAPDLPEKVKTYVGTVVWRTENVTQGQSQPIGTAIEADVTIPDAKLQFVMRIRRNTEPQFPASHTLDLSFTVSADSPLGTIKQINVPQMRQQDSPTGEGLAGIPVTIADNIFLVGLMRGNAEDRNLDLLRSRGWFDIPMLLANGKASKITFEKGASGDRIFADVIDSWKNAQN